MEITMNNFKLSVIISAVLLSVTSMAQAETSIGQEESANRLNHNFSSKRAYHAPADLSAANKSTDQFEGATLVPNDEDSVDSKKARHLKQLQMHSIGRRP
jgi:hypothetical protein